MHRHGWKEHQWPRFPNAFPKEQKNGEKELSNPNNRKEKKSSKSGKSREYSAVAAPYLLVKHGEVYYPAVTTVNERAHNIRGRLKITSFPGNEPSGTILTGEGFSISNITIKRYDVTEAFSQLYGKRGTHAMTVELSVRILLDAMADEPIAKSSRSRKAEKENKDYNPRFPVVSLSFENTFSSIESSESSFAISPTVYKFKDNYGLIQSITPVVNSIEENSFNLNLVANILGTNDHLLNELISAILASGITLHFISQKGY